MFAKAWFGCFTAKDHSQSRAPVSTDSFEVPSLFCGPVSGVDSDAMTDGTIFIDLPPSAVLHKVSSGPHQWLGGGLKTDHVPMAGQPANATLNSPSYPTPSPASGHLASVPATASMNAVTSPTPSLAGAKAVGGSMMTATPATKPVEETAGETNSPATPVDMAGVTTAPAMPVLAAAPVLAALGGGLIGGSCGGGGSMRGHQDGTNDSLPRPQKARKTSGPANLYILEALARRAGSATMIPRRPLSSGDGYANIAGIVQAFTRGRSLSVAVAETRAARECLSRGILPAGGVPDSSSIGRSSKCSDSLLSLRAARQMEEGRAASGSVPRMITADRSSFLVPLGYGSVGGGIRTTSACPQQQQQEQQRTLRPQTAPCGGPVRSSALDAPYPLLLLKKKKELADPTMSLAAGPATGRREGDDLSFVPDAGI